MLIESIEIFHVGMPLIQPWRTAYGEDATIESVLVRMTGGGETGWGESSPLAAPCYSPEWAGGVFACVRDWGAPVAPTTGRHARRGRRGGRFRRAGFDRRTDRKDRPGDRCRLQTREAQ